MRPPVGWPRFFRTRRVAASRRYCVGAVGCRSRGTSESQPRGPEPWWQTDAGTGLCVPAWRRMPRWRHIEARSDTAHRLADPQPPARRCEMCGGISGSAVGVEDHPIDWCAAPTYGNGHLDRIAGQRGIRMISKRAGQQTPPAQVKHGRHYVESDSRYTPFFEWLRRGAICGVGPRRWAAWSGSDGLDLVGRRPCRGSTPRHVPFGQ